VKPARAAPKLGGAELRNAQKEYAAAGRKLEKLAGQIADIHQKLALHNQNDYTGLGVLTTDVQGLETQVQTLELRWLELAELLGE
jgi:ATP-binding cassette subfamily F protein uup